MCIITDPKLLVTTINLICFYSIMLFQARGPAQIHAHACTLHKYTRSVMVVLMIDAVHLTGYSSDRKNLCVTYRNTQMFQFMSIYMRGARINANEMTNGMS